jgi:hypothetical protein
VASKPNDLLRKGLAATIDLLVDSKKQVVLVEDNPHWAFDPIRLEIAKVIPLRNELARLTCTNCAPPDNSDVSMQYVENADYGKVIQNLHLESHQPVRYLDLWTRFCGASYCIFKNTSGLFFFDPGHLSAYGARYALRGMTLSSN